MYVIANEQFLKTFTIKGTLFIKRRKNECVKDLI